MQYQECDFIEILQLNEDHWKKCCRSLWKSLTLENVKEKNIVNIKIFNLIKFKKYLWLDKFNLNTWRFLNIRNNRLYNTINIKYSLYLRFTQPIIKTNKSMIFVMFISHITFHTQIIILTGNTLEPQTCNLLSVITCITISKMTMCHWYWKII